MEPDRRAVWQAEIEGRIRLPARPEPALDHDGCGGKPRPAQREPPSPLTGHSGSPMENPLVAMEATAFNGVSG
ncbi:hypothetical protein, partial [Dactylosporangium sp. NPDC000521]|uniref:hypothetical protein n=1 Tax=Dactylosporangium sp. NPDC000521 TaxID=3363975 RepID=UPI00368F0C5B